MPLSSGSGPSLGGSGSAVSFSARTANAASEAASSDPKSAGGSARNIRPNGPSKSRELECAPAGGQIGRFELTPFAGLPEDGSHDKAPVPQCGVQAPSC